MSNEFVGDAAAEFFSTSTLDPIAGADPSDYGDQVDLDAAGTKVYVLNNVYNPLVPAVAKRPNPKAFIAPVVGEPTIDIYEAATGAHLESFPLGGGSSVRGIADRPEWQRIPSRTSSVRFRPRPESRPIADGDGSSTSTTRSECS